MNEEKVQFGAIYKTKEGESLCYEEILSPYVRVQDFISNPLEKEIWYVEFYYIFKDSLNPTTKIYPVKFLPYDVFLKYFELDMDLNEVSKLAYKLKEIERKGR